MIVKVKPTFEVCKCGICGTVFQPEAGDNIDYRILPSGEVYKIAIGCPTCSFWCDVTVKGKYCVEGEQ